MKVVFAERQLRESIRTEVRGRREQGGCSEVGQGSRRAEGEGMTGRSQGCDVLRGLVGKSMCGRIEEISTR